MAAEAEAAREARAKVIMMMLIRMMVIWLVMRMILLMMITEAAREARAKVIGLKIRLLGFFKYWINGLPCEPWCQIKSHDMLTTRWSPPRANRKQVELWRRRRLSSTRARQRFRLSLFVCLFFLECFDSFKWCPQSFWLWTFCFYYWSVTWEYFKLNIFPPLATLSLKHHKNTFRSLFDAQF